MTHKKPLRAFTRLASLMLVLMLAACATGEVATGPSIYADNRDFMIVEGQPGDTMRSLAAQYLGDASLAPVVEDLNGPASANGRAIILPKRPLNRSAVDVNGYQVVPILCYHQFTKGTPRNRMQVSVANFEAQMRYLKDNGYRVITLDDLDGFLSGDRPIPERAVVVTIDDGYRSTYDLALPILEKLGLPATLYIYSDFAGVSMSWDEIRALDGGDVIDIQSHSKSHTSMSPNGDEKPGPAYVARVEEEVSVPHRIFKKRLGVDMEHFAYPYGDTSADVVKLMEKYNYDTAVTVQRGGNASFTHPYLLRRDMVYSDHTLADFKKFLTVYKKANLK